MRNALVVVALTLGVLGGYALRAVPTAAQADTFQPFAAGTVVRLTVQDFPSGVTTITCQVSQVTEGFIACDGDGNRLGARREPRWVNLRFVQEIRPAPER